MNLRGFRLLKKIYIYLLAPAKWVRIGETELNAGSAPRFPRSAHDAPARPAKLERGPGPHARRRRSPARPGPRGHKAADGAGRPRLPNPEIRLPGARAGAGAGTGPREPEEQMAWAGTPGRAPYRRFRTWPSATSRGGAASRGSPRSSGPAGGRNGGVSRGRPRRRVGNGEGRDPEHRGVRGPRGNRPPPLGCGPAGLAAPRMRAAPGPAPPRTRVRARPGAGPGL